MSDPAFYVLWGWMILASVLINIDRWRIRKLERENRKLWDIVNRAMSKPTTKQIRGRIHVATKEIKDSDNG